MMMHRTLLRALAVLFVAASTLACADGLTDPGDSGAPVALAIQIAGADALVDRIVVEVTGPGIPVPIVVNLELVEGTATGTIVVPPGPDRVFTAQGFGSDGGVTHEGSVTLDVRPGMSSLQIPLVPRGVGVPVEVVVSYYLVTIDPAVAEMNIGETRAFGATVTDAQGEPRQVAAEDLTWGSSNPVIAVVDDLGQVTAGGQPGTARIVVSYEGVAAEAELMVTGEDLLSIQLASSTNEPEPGAPFELTATVRNRGEEGVADVIVYVVLPNLNVVDWIADYGCNFFPFADDSGVAAQCAIPVLDPDDEAVVSLTVRSFLVQGTALAVEGAIYSWEGPEDPYPANNEVELAVGITHGRIVFASDRGGSFDLFTVRPDGSDLVQLTSSASDDTYPAWSPDRGRIAFVRDGAVWLVNADGTGEMQLDVPADNSPTWAPDGTRIAVSGRPPSSDYLQILIYDLEAGTTSNLIDLVEHEWANNSDWAHPDWSPSGGSFAATLHRGDDFDWTWGALSADGSNFQDVSEYHGGTCLLVSWSLPLPLRWSPRGNAATAATSTHLQVRTSESVDGILCGLFSNVTEVGGDAEYTASAWSPDAGTLVAARRPEGGYFDLVTINSDLTGAMINITNWPANDIHPDWW